LIPYKRYWDDEFGYNASENPIGIETSYEGDRIKREQNAHQKDNLLFSDDNTTGRYM